MPKFFIVLISLLCILIFGTFVVLPKYRDFRVSNAEVSGKQAELASQEEYISQLESLSKKLEQYPEELSKINLALSPDVNLPSLFEFLGKACSENGLVFKKVGSFSSDIFKEYEDEKIKETRIEFEVSGTFDALLSFLSTLEKSARLIEVSHISFVSPKEGDVFSFKMQVKVYSY